MKLTFLEGVFKRFKQFKQIDFLLPVKEHQHLAFWYNITVYKIMQIMYTCIEYMINIPAYQIYLCISILQ